MSPRTRFTLKPPGLDIWHLRAKGGHRVTVVLNHIVGIESIAPTEASIENECCILLSGGHIVQVAHAFYDVCAVFEDWKATIGSGRNE